MPVAGVADAQDFPRGRARRAESAPAPPASEAESIEQLTRSNIEVIPRLERERQARRPWACRMAASIAGFCGTAPVLWLHAIYL